MQSQNGRTLVDEFGGKPPRPTLMDHVHRELNYWVDRPKLDEVPAKLSDLRPLPKLAVAGLLVTAPFYLVTWPSLSMSTSHHWQRRSELYRHITSGYNSPDVCRQAFRLHESVLAGSNPLRWAYEAAPTATLAVIGASLGCHAAMIYRQSVKYSRGIKSAQLTILGGCALQTLFTSLCLNSTSIRDWLKMAGH